MAIPVGPAGPVNGFDGRTVLVTGAGGDFGQLAALRFSQAGAVVLACDHPSARERLDETVLACADAGGRTVVPVTFDVTDVDATKQALQSAINDGGVPDMVFNNAGIQGAFAPTHEYPLADAARVIDVNVVGALNVMAAAAEAMVTAGVEGAIVNMASMAGVTGAPNMVAYSASKAAIIGMTKSAAKDLAPYGIRVNAVSPAFIGPGAMWDRQVELQASVGSQYFPSEPERVAEMMISSVPMRRYGSVGEVIDVVSYLLSDRAGYVTGANVEVSGGAA